MNARQNPIAKFESFMQRIIETPFARLFPSRLEPVELARKLETVMEDNLIISVERRLAPTVYDIYLSQKDHQRLASDRATQATLIKELQDHLVAIARQKHYTLRSVPVLRLHTDSGLRTGQAHIEVEQADRAGGGAGANASGGEAGGVMATQAISAEQMAILRAQMMPSSSPMPGPSSPSLPGQPGVGAPIIPPTPVPVAIPPARLTIRLPQAPEQVYRIEKPVVNIGRQLSNDIIVEDKRVSRYHAQIKFQPDGQFAIFDLGSTNGITINGKPEMRQHILRSGDRFTIGSYDFYFERR